MCGIVGGVCSGDIRPLLINGLVRMEYRGYDSAGIAIATENGICRCVTVGRTTKLRQQAAALAGGLGIGHTRWATHGIPSEQNAHPLRAGRVLVVHNGIIENHADLRCALAADGRKFSSDTDSEVVAHLLDAALERYGDFLSAWRSVREKLVGAYAISAMVDGGDMLFAARQGSPLLLGEGRNGSYIASDVQALAGVAMRMHYLENGAYAVISKDGIRLYDEKDNAQEFVWQLIDSRSVEVQLGEYTHFMQKEIFEQPEAAAATMQPFVKVPHLSLRRFGSGMAKCFRRLQQVSVVACGTSYHAGLIAGYWMESFGIPCRVEIASEYRYRVHPLVDQSLFIGVSQSGETADTLAAMRAAQEAGAATLAVVNVETSSMQREAEWTFCTRAGAEIGVASTKSFVAQLVALLLLALGIAQARRCLPAEQEEHLLRKLKQLPNLLSKTLLLEKAVHRWAHALAVAKSAVYVGRGRYYPLALEGALKLKEISYIHAEGCPAGELKHGSLALVDDDLPVIGLAPDDELLAKMTANLTEIATRGGQLYVLAGQKFRLDGLDEERIVRIADDGGEFLSPMVYAVLLQLLAYHTARQKGTDIDKPRNLAKAVTVE